MATCEYEIEDAETIVIVDDEAAFAALPAFEEASQGHLRAGSSLSTRQWTPARSGQASPNLLAAFGQTGRRRPTDCHGSNVIRKSMNLEASGNPRDGPRIMVEIPIMELSVTLGNA
jgi:hypothetical protein